MFTDRCDAGRDLSRMLHHLVSDDVIVLGIPRGGVVVAHEVAVSLHAPLDVVVVRKLGVPWNPELAYGAIGEDGERFIDDEIVRTYGIGHEAMRKVESEELMEVRRRASVYRQFAHRMPLDAKTAVVVDDGIATGATARAACAMARRAGARRVVLAVPVVPAGWAHDNADVADEIVTCYAPHEFGSVGAHYERFDQVDDATVRRLLAQAQSPAYFEDVEITVNPWTSLEGRLDVPADAHGIVVFSHGSGSSKMSPRNRAVAERLNDAGFATLLFDLLTPSEARLEHLRFDVDLLAERLSATIGWLRSRPETSRLPLGIFGASTGAAAAIVAATTRTGEVRAIVSRGGRPDLAGHEHLSALLVPTLFVVGGNDHNVEEANRMAMHAVPASTKLIVVPEATHLFEEPGAMDQVVEAAIAHFGAHLVTTVAAH